jgi:hypothetical protein
MKGNDRPMTEPTNLARRIADLINETAQQAELHNGYGNPREVAAAILADAALCAAIGDYVAANDPNDAARQLEAIDLVLAHLDEYRGTGLIGLNQLGDALVRFRCAVEEQFAEDIELGEAYLRYAEQFADCHTPAGVGGLIRAAIVKIGATITPGPKAAPASEPAPSEVL